MGCTWPQNLKSGLLGSSTLVYRKDSRTREPKEEAAGGSEESRALPGRWKGQEIVVVPNRGRHFVSPTPVLQQHQALGSLAVLLGAEQEEAGAALQGHVVVMVVQGAGPGQALEGGMELQGGVAVALVVVALAHLRGNCKQHGGRRQDHPEGVSDEGGAARAAAGADMLAAFSEPSYGDT